VHDRQVFRHRIAGSFIVALFASGTVVAGTEELEFYSQRIDKVAKELVASIRPTLDARAQKIVDDISFETPLSWETNAAARRAFGNRRVVEFNAGFLAVTDWLALAMISDWAGHEGCLKESSDYLAQLVSHNSRRMFKGKDRRQVYDFTAYTQNTHGHCEGALVNTLDGGRREELREEMLNSIVATVLLHEIAHHVLDHVSGYGTNIVQRRFREVEADRWAFNTAVNANYELRTAVPLFLFLAATGGGTLEDDIRSGHPSGLRRVRDLLVQTRSLLDAKDPVGAHVLDASIEDLNRSLR
jgi:predicted Zn-dependent protease with MMP-like domain